MAGEFIDVSLKMQISPFNKSQEKINGKIIAKFTNTKDQSEKTINLKIIPTEKESNYEHGKEYILRAVAYIPEIKPGLYNLQVYFNDLSDKNILVAKPISIQIKSLMTDKKWLSITPSEKSGAFATFALESTESSIKVNALEMGTEDGGTIKDAINFGLYNHDTGEKITDLVDLSTLANTNANYNLYYLKAPITISPNQKITVDLRGISLHTNTPNSELNKEERSRIDFTIAGIHAENQDYETVYRPLEIAASLVTDPNKIITVSMVFPSSTEQTTISSDQINVKWLMHYPSAYLNKNEIAGFEILVCKDPETSCPISRFEDASYFTKSRDLLDKDSQFSYPLNLSTLANGNYTVTVTATSITYQRTDLLSRISQYSDKAKIRIER